jgi:hypothetical protein
MKEGKVNLSISHDRIKDHVNHAIDLDIAAFKNRETKKLDWILQTPDSAELYLNSKFEGSIKLVFNGKVMLYHITYEISSNNGTVYAKIVTRINVPIPEKKNTLKFRSIAWVKENFFK